MDNYAYQPDGNTGPFAITGYAPRKAPNEYLVEVNSRSKILKKPVFYKGLAALFFLLAIIFLITLIVIITTDRRKFLPICTTDECLRTATNLKLSLDLNVDPCENFYQFTCGKWSEEHPNHGWWSSFSSFTTITEKVAISSLKALTTEVRQSDEPEALQKSRDFYKACMDVEAQDSLGLTPMYQYIKRVNLPVIPTYFTNSDADNVGYIFDWMKTETTIKHLLMVDILIGATVDANIFNGSENVIYIGVPYQKSPLPSPFKAKKLNSAGTVNANNASTGEDDEAYKRKAKEIHTNVIKYVIKQIALNVTDKDLADVVLEDAANVILNISDTIDELISNYTDADAIEDDSYSISISKLQSETDSVLDVPQPWLWKSYLKDLFIGTNITVDQERDVLFVTDLDLEYLKKIIPYLYTTPNTNLELYVWWKTVYAMIINTSSDIVEYISKETSFFSTSLGTVSRSRSLECALLANNYMGYAVSYALADKSFLNTTKPKVDRMIKELKNAFVDHVNGITWMDAATKRVTLEKSKEMITFIGYPDWLFEEGELDKYYEDVVMKPDTYLDNMISQIMSYSLKKLKSLREKHERDWHSEPIEVNAFNSFSDNAINVPMAILDFPMYNLGLEVLNYGSIGSILGHELTHGFDNTGRKHDKYGNFVQWWTNKTIDRFENLTQCFIKQYDNFTVEGVEGHVKGKFTLGENLADNGGINQAYAAYKNRVKYYGEEPSLPGFENYSNYQLFFIAYGSIWCETNSIADLKDQLEYDEHCPNSVRVIGTLQNSEDFARTFKCPEGSYMNPKTKCKIW